MFRESSPCSLLRSLSVAQKSRSPFPGKPGVMEDYGWLEHTARRVWQVMRPELLAVLEEQGFALR